MHIELGVKYTKQLAFSSEIYFIKAEELKSLPKNKEHKINNIQKETQAVILLNDTKNQLIFGFDAINNANDDEFIKTKIAYFTYSPLKGFFLGLIKPIKRKFYTRNNESYTVLFDKLLEAKLTRGERNRENAYQWTNKKWKISPQEAQQRYLDLYESLKQNGYDKKSPMFVMLNRKLGVKDQILQGHHRIGICKEIGLKTVNISFWTAPASFRFFKIFTQKRK